MRKISKLSKFPVSLPVELHRRFKMQCAANGVLMAEVVRGLIERECLTGAPTECTKRIPRSTRREGVSP